MPSISLTLPTPGTKILSGLHATNYAAIQTLLNGGLDGSNFSSAAPIGLSGLGITLGADVNLYRSAANTLKTDDTFFAVGAIASGVGTAGQVQLTNGANPEIIFGLSGDTNLYRSAANILRTDDAFEVGGRVHIDPNGTGGDIIFQGDTNLYRTAANNLKTDGQLDVGDDIWLTTNAGKLFFGASADTYLDRATAGMLRTQGQLQIDAADTGGRLYFGPNSDTFMFRAAAGAIQTNGRFEFANAGAAFRWTSASAQQTTVGAAGGATALPATPLGYLKVAKTDGATVVIPYYNA